MLTQHLKNRHLDLDLHRPMLDEAEGVVTDLLFKFG